MTLEKKGSLYTVSWKQGLDTHFKTVDEETAQLIYRAMACGREEVRSSIRSVLQ